MTVNDWSRIKHFKPEEFDSPDEPGSGLAKMDPDFVYKLDVIRESLGQPLKINSGYRSYMHNRRIGGKIKSAHLEGCAADISAQDPVFKFALVAAAIKAGIRRIGVGAMFIHLDASAKNPSPRIWTYPPGSKV